MQGFLLLPAVLYRDRSFAFGTRFRRLRIVIGPELIVRAVMLVEGLAEYLLCSRLIGTVAAISVQLPWPGKRRVLSMGIGGAAAHSSGTPTSTSLLLLWPSRCFLDSMRDGVSNRNATLRSLELSSGLVGRNSSHLHFSLLLCLSTRLSLADAVRAVAQIVLTCLSTRGIGASCCAKDCALADCVHFLEGTLAERSLL